MAETHNSRSPDGAKSLDNPLPSDNPLVPILRAQGVVILDGGLATTLEDQGFDLRDSLWSARLLRDDPEAIRRVHTQFLEAGADCISTATYQASVPGFRDQGITESEAIALFDLAVQLATDARDSFWSDPANRTGRVCPLVAASIGPFGAFLANGSEYRGDYAVGPEALRAFHAPRWEVLSRSTVDLLACETIPSAAETEVLLESPRGDPGPMGVAELQLSRRRAHQRRHLPAGGRGPL